MHSSGLNYQKVSKAIAKGGSVRAAARILGKSYTAVQWWIARNGYRIKKRAELVRVEQKGKSA